MKIKKDLVGKRITIVNYLKSHLDFVSNMWFDKENGKYLSDPEKEFIDAEFQKAVDELEDNPHGYYFVVTKTDTGELIGSCCAFPDYDDEDKLFFDIGYCINKAYWKKGFGTETVILLLSWIKEAGAKYVTAEAAKENTASVKLLKKLEFEVIKESTIKKYNMDISYDSFIFKKTIS